MPKVPTATACCSTHSGRGLQSTPTPTALVPHTCWARSSRSGMHRPTAAFVGAPHASVCTLLGSTSVAVHMCHTRRTLLRPGPATW